MCLNLKEKFKRRDEARAFTKKPRIAGRAIRVYKLLCFEDDGCFLEYYSPYRGVLYTPTEEKKVQKFSFNIVDACGWRISVNKGIHSYKHPESAVEVFDTSEHKMKYVIVECIIPKGTPYFKNDEEYVSLQLNIPDLEFKVVKKKKELFAVPNKEWSFLSEITFSPEWTQLLLEDFK